MNESQTMSDFSPLLKLRSRYASDETQVVGVKFPDSDKVYSYVGGGTLRTGQNIDAPVTNKWSGKNYIVPKKHVQIVETHGIVGANVGDKVGVTNNKVHRIPTGLKYLAGAKEIQRNPEIQVENGRHEKLMDYLKKFKGGRSNE